MKTLKYKVGDEYLDLYKVYQEPAPVDPFNGYEYVDMGEAGIWATCNVGANSPEEYGDYFAWGEIETKESYDQNNYKFGQSPNYTKYNNTDNLTTLELEDDAAHINMGGNWRMPTMEEGQKLIDLCTVSISSNNKCLDLTLKSDPSKKLTIAGYSSLSFGFWTSSLKENLYNSACTVNGWFDSEYYIPEVQITHGNRCLRQNIRAIYDPSIKSE